MQVKVPVRAPVSHFATLVFTDTRYVAHYNRSNPFLDTPGNDVLREGVEVVSTASRLLVVQPGRLLLGGIITLSNVLAEVVVVLLQTVQRIQLRVSAPVVSCSEVADSEVDTDCFRAG